MDIAVQLAHIVGNLLWVLAFAIFARAMVSWFPIDREGPIVRILDAVTDPIVQPLRRIIPPIGVIDLTPTIAMIILFVAANYLQSAR